jgi:hypothetical protein
MVTAALRAAGEQVASFSGKGRKMRHVLAVVVMIGFILFASARRLDALEYQLHPNNKSTFTAILATGVIELGDTQRLDTLLRTLPQTSNRAVYLASDGGNLYEGIKLGLYFHEKRIKTVVEGGRDCASACALAFLGGTDSKGLPWRSSSTNSRLGFHAFSGITEMPISPDDVQGIVAAILAYGKHVNAPIELLIAGFSTPSRNIFWVSQEDICALRIKLWSNTTGQFICN